MITVRLTGERPCPEWAIIELQGEVTVTDLQRESLTFGKLQASALSADGVDLTIGYHKLSGKSVKLKKPLVLVEKAQQTDDSGQALEYKTVGVVRQKLLFKTRPKALISAPQQRR